jgi:hypothetical protein
VVNADDWTFGETILPFAVWRDFGELPFADIMPVRGIISFLDAAVAEILFNGTAPDIGRASAVVGLLFSALVFFPVFAAAGAIAAAFAVIAVDFGPGGQPDCLFVAAFCVVCALLIRARERGAIIGWLLLTPAMFLLAPGYGLLYAVATLPLLIAATLRSDRQALIVPAIVLFAVMACGVIAIESSAGSRVVVGMVRYFSDNVAVNTIAHGIPWFAWRTLEGLQLGFLYEFVRSFALPIAGALLAYAATLLPHHTSIYSRDAWLSYLRSEQFVSLSIALSATGVVIVFLPRALGRIDPVGGSRIGALTLLMLGGIASVVVRRLPDLRWKPLLLPIATAIVAGVHGMNMPLPSTSLLMARLRIVSAATLTDAAGLGLHRAGVAAFDQAHLQRLVALKQSIDALLPPGEPYYDLSNHNADYVYFDRPVPAAWSGPFYLADERAQVRVIEELRARGTKLMLLSADNNNADGGSSALRAYWLYRFVLEDYLPFSINGFMFAVRSDLADSEPFRSIFAASPPSTDLFETAFAESDLNAIPLSWGRSDAILASRLESTKASLPLQANSKGIVVPPNFDLLRLAVSCPPDLVTQASLKWDGERNGHVVSGAARFTASAGTLLVPIGAYPSWILAERIDNVTLSLPPNTCHVASASLHRRLAPPY